MYYIPCLEWGCCIAGDRSTLTTVVPFLQSGRVNDDLALCRLPSMHCGLNRAPQAWFVGGSFVHGKHHRDTHYVIMIYQHRRSFEKSEYGSMKTLKCANRLRSSVVHADLSPQHNSTSARSYSATVQVWDNHRGSDFCEQSPSVCCEMYCAHVCRQRLLSVISG